jgi:hypothetical protein
MTLTRHAHAPDSSDLTNSEFSEPKDLFYRLPLGLHFHCRLKHTSSNTNGKTSIPDARLHYSGRLSQLCVCIAIVLVLKVVKGRLALGSRVRLGTNEGTHNNVHHVPEPWHCGGAAGWTSIDPYGNGDGYPRQCHFPVENMAREIRAKQGVPFTNLRLAKGV